MNENNQLKLFEDPYLLPTGKFHISYSELFEFLECSFRHKLKHIKKLDPFAGSIHTAFGNAVHTALEQYVLTGNQPSVETCEADFKERLEKFLFTKEEVTSKDAKEFIDVIPEILRQVPLFLDEQFPGWQLVSAEEDLFEYIPGQTNKWFKGFIDLVIKVPKRKPRRKTTLSGLKGEIIPGEYVYYMLDWKTTSWGWQAKQKRSFNKQLQLILYKKFWCQKTGIPVENVKTGWVFLKRRPNKDGSRIEMLLVSVGPKALEKASIQLQSALNQIMSGRVSKNKMSCMWCSFKGTTHCP